MSNALFLVDYDTGPMVPAPSLCATKVAECCGRPGLPLNREIRSHHTDGSDRTDWFGRRQKDQP
jgi:hypothetical protein